MLAEAGPPRTAPSLLRVALLGTGNVGSAVWMRLRAWTHAPPITRLRVVHVANSRYSATHHDGFDLAKTPAAMLTGKRGESIDAALAGKGVRVIIDATASEAVADQHARWLAEGIHVVTACKLGSGTQLSRWRAIRAACVHGDACYGDSATVGAGLPLLRSLRELRAGGDRIHGIAGVLSGSLAWLLHHYDGVLPFSELVRQARTSGYTEPDPREDLSGEDARRKLLILARAGGFELDTDAVAVGSLVPTALSSLAACDVDAGLHRLDVPLRRHHAAARQQGARLHYVARLGDGGARVGLEALAPDDPLAGGTGTDNRVAIWSDRYRTQPLVIQGPGAGPEVTAAALLDDVLRIAGRTRARAVG